MFRRLLALGLLFLLVACAGYKLVPPAQTTVANFSVAPDIAWSQASHLTLQSSAPIAAWTVDGPALNQILFLGGVKSGDPLFTPSNRGTDEQKKNIAFRDTMGPAEIAELWEAVFAQFAQTTLAATSNVEPARFGGIEGFKFDFAFTSKDEVERRGVIYGAVKDKKLYLIYYTGTKLYHYGLRLPNAMKAIESARIVG